MSYTCRRVFSFREGEPVFVHRDAAMFQAIDRLLQQADGNPSAEQRTSARSSYPCWQRIAPFDERRTPDLSEFENLRCLDLSASGFSYLSPQAPSTGMVVVALGPEDRPTLMSAKIVRTAPLHFIGCQFQQRLK